MINSNKRTVWGSILVSCFLFLVSGFSQAAPPSDTWPINQRTITIPIRIDPARRQEIKQLMLYASADQGRNWSDVAVATPEKESFTFNAMTDGIYWFHLVIVDNQGGRVPSDLEKSPP